MGKTQHFCHKSWATVVKKCFKSWAKLEYLVSIHKKKIDLYDSVASTDS